MEQKAEAFSHASRYYQEGQEEQKRGIKLDPTDKVPNKYQSEQSPRRKCLEDKLELPRGSITKGTVLALAQHAPTLHREIYVGNDYCIGYFQDTGV